MFSPETGLHAIVFIVIGELRLCYAIAEELDITSYLADLLPLHLSRI